MKKLLFLFCILHVVLCGSLSAMEKDKKERCCYGGVMACVRRNITTPLWFNWHYKRFIKELQEAVYQNNAQKVTEIIGYGISPNGYKSDWGYTSHKFLEPALRNGSSDAAMALLNAGCTPTYHELACAFDHAVKEEVRNLMLAKYLATRECDKDPALGLVMQKGTQEQIAFVLKNGASLNAESVGSRGYEKFTPLLHAVLHRREMVPFLLEQGAQVTNPPIEQAIKLGDIAVLHMLIRKHPFIIKGMQGTSKKKRKKKFEHVLALLLKKEKEKPDDGRLYGEKRPFHRGLRNAPVHMIRHLCSLGVDPNWQDGNGQTALFHVDEYKKVRALLECGARADTQDAQGKTVVHVLSGKSKTDLKYYKVLKALLVHPLLMRSEDVSEKAKQAVFTSLCCLRRVCPTLPLDIRMRILLEAFEDEYYCSQWGKFMRNVSIREVVCNVPLEEQLQLIENRELSPGSFGSILDKEKLIQANTERHMIDLRSLLCMPDREAFLPFHYAQGTVREQLSIVALPLFNYNWRGKVEREYRFLFDTGTLYTADEKNT